MNILKYLIIVINYLNLIYNPYIILLKWFLKEVIDHHCRFDLVNHFTYFLNFNPYQINKILNS